MAAFDVLPLAIRKPVNIRCIGAPSYRVCLSAPWHRNAAALLSIDPAMVNTVRATRWTAGSGGNCQAVIERKKMNTGGLALSA